MVCDAQCVTLTAVPRQPVAKYSRCFIAESQKTIIAAETHARALNLFC